MERVLAVFGAIHILIDATAMVGLWFAYRNASKIYEDWRTDGRI